MKKILLILSIFVSSIFASNISTYLTSDLKNISEVKTNLKKAGFIIIGSYDALADKNYQVVVYTSNELKELASKKNRGFSAVQKVLVSNNDSKLIFTNPAYYLKAMLQKDYNPSLVGKVLSKLNSAFKLDNGKYNLDEDDLASYHFMFAMPYYEDMAEVASGDNLNQLLKNNAKDNIVFELKVGNATLYGIAMHEENGEQVYIKTLKQEASSAFLPYMVLIEDNKAKILAPKYYLALSLPQLTMGEFMTISDVPGQIEEYFIKLFK